MGKPSVAVDDEFRPDIEGLRAVAVVVVVLFHAKIARFSGGFVGVDVFFVLSGFLITRLLLREVATTGTISLRHFWARRARRLLPASCVVVVVTVLASQVLLSPIAQRPLATDALAAGGFVDQLRVRRPARRLLRIAGGPDAVAAAALLVAGGRGAVLSVLAAGVACVCAADPADTGDWSRR